jgi:hypothetical protein
MTADLTRGAAVKSSLIESIRQLASAEIRKLLGERAAEDKALRALLRAAIAREREERRQQREEVASRPAQAVGIRPRVVAIIARMAIVPEALIQIIEGELASVTLRPDSVLVLMSDDQLSAPLRSVLRMEIEQRFPGHGAKLLILDQGKRLAVVNRSEEDHADEAAKVPPSGAQDAPTGSG